ncbi:hypothetical protein C9374_013453 [Naegleria lovaniensis]|uniref:Uncharacterized protein n=1 Tax=Naegleria lovaniensis TaxID=51637 RepID=A0AA88GVU5_NAELO|nr:uncharacterized protein C9374_013453 [Naegleria lovaniensis]KAG2391968.1 hypothetical protein C9374_013453 [Naegleria lovaniensis]
MIAKNLNQVFVFQPHLLHFHHHQHYYHTSSLIRKASGMLLQYPSLLPSKFSSSMKFLENGHHPSSLIHVMDILQLSSSLFKHNPFHSAATLFQKQYFSLSSNSMLDAFHESKISIRNPKKQLQWKFILMLCAFPGLIYVLYSGMKMMNIWKYNNMTSVSGSFMEHSVQKQHWNDHSTLTSQQHHHELSLASEDENYSIVKGLLYDVLKFPVTCCLVGLNIFILLIFR